VKFLEYGIQDNTWAAKTYDRASESTVTELRPVKEHFVRIHMPWKRPFYNASDDVEGLYHPCFHFYWHRHPTVPGFGFARWGWQ
jgi:hypothetical protein